MSGRFRVGAALTGIVVLTAAGLIFMALRNRGFVLPGKPLASEAE